MTVSFATVILVFVFAPVLFPSVEAPYWFHDHFFNTLKIVENFRSKGFPTFDGVSSTNDFSLLWGMTLTGLSALIPSKTTLFFSAVRLLTGLAAALSLFLFNRLTDALESEPEKEARFAVSAFLLALFFYAAYAGSDVALAIPCVFLNALCLLKALKKPSFLSGMLAGLTVFLCACARFDSMLFAATAALVLYFQFNDKYPVSKKQGIVLLTGMIVGLLPLMVCADLMQSKFGSPAPTEILSWGTAQDMAPWRIFTVVFFEPIRYAFRIPQASALMMFPVLLLLLVAYASFPWHGQEQTPRETVFYALIWYPVVFLTGTAFLTFVALPEYAFYSIAAGAPFALLFATHKINTQVSGEDKNTAKRVWLILGGLFLILSLNLSFKKRSAFYPPIVRAIAEFSEKHPGRYAMSTGAGISSFLTGTEIVRLDGLATDKDFLKMLDSQESLDAAFRRYNVDYYIALNPQKGESCYSAREPAQNRFGGTNKGLSVWICADPVFEKQTNPKIKLSVFKIDSSGRAVSASDEKYIETGLVCETDE